MKKYLIALLALTMLLAACGDDGVTSETSTTAGDGPQLTAEETEWCTLADATDATAFRFDQIFEAGLSLSLPMDALNAQASQLRTQYESEGLTGDEAIIRVFQDLTNEPVFIEACKQAYFLYADNG